MCGLDVSWLQGVRCEPLEQVGPHARMRSAPGLCVYCYAKKHPRTPVHVRLTRASLNHYLHSYFREALYSTREVIVRVRVALLWTRRCRASRTTRCTTKISASTRCSRARASTRTRARVSGPTAASCAQHCRVYAMTL